MSYIKSNKLEENVYLFIWYENCPVDLNSSGFFSPASIGMFMVVYIRVTMSFNKVPIFIILIVSCI